MDVITFPENGLSILLDGIFSHPDPTSYDKNALPLYRVTNEFASEKGLNAIKRFRRYGLMFIRGNIVQSI